MNLLTETLLTTLNYQIKEQQGESVGIKFVGYGCYLFRLSADHSDQYCLEYWQAKGSNGKTSGNPFFLWNSRDLNSPVSPVDLLEAEAELFHKGVSGAIPMAVQAMQKNSPVTR